MSSAPGLLRLGHVMCRSLAALPMLLLGSGLVGATTWQVEADPANPEGRIEAVAMSAASGDSIVIGPGLYYEHIQIPLIELTLIGRDGAAATVLDGSRTFPGHTGSILCVQLPVSNDPGSLRLRGLTFQKGWGRLGRGGAVSWGGSGAGLDVQDCVFVENGRSPDTQYGGAIESGVATRVRIERCLFSNNYATEGGGAIYSLYCGPIDILSSTFFTDTGRTFVMIQYNADDFMPGSRIRIEECTSRASGSQPGQTGFWFDTVDTEILNNRFEDLDANSRSATKLVFLHEDQLHPARDATVSGNVFWHPPGGTTPSEAQVYFPAGGSVNIDVTGNTFVRTPVELWWGTGTVSFERNLLADSGLYWAKNGGTIACNDFWLQPLVVDPQCSPVLIDNQEADPLLCDDPNGDVHIADVSPCAPPHSPAGCGLIGAQDVGCSATPVETTTWGRVKARFR